MVCRLLTLSTLFLGNSRHLINLHSIRKCSKLYENHMVSPVCREKPDLTPSMLQNGWVPVLGLIPARLVIHFHCSSTPKVVLCVRMQLYLGKEGDVSGNTWREGWGWDRRSAHPGHSQAVRVLQHAEVRADALLIFTWCSKSTICLTLTMFIYSILWELGPASWWGDSLEFLGQDSIRHCLWDTSGCLQGQVHCPSRLWMEAELWDTLPHTAMPQQVQTAQGYRLCCAAPGCSGKQFAAWKALLWEGGRQAGGCVHGHSSTLCLTAGDSIEGACEGQIRVILLFSI